MNTNEEKIQQTGQELVLVANSLVVTNEEQYQQAGEFLKQVKSNIKNIEEFFADMKKSAHKAWKDICDKESSYKNRLAEAEKIVKSSMSSFLAEQEKKRREEEARIRAEQEKLALEQLKKAEELREQGQETAAAIAEETAYMIDTMKTTVHVSKPTVQGVSAVSDWDVEIVNDKLVPVEFNGMMLRPVDTAAIKKLAKTFKGKIQIPGVKIIETKNVRVRA